MVNQLLTILTVTAFIAFTACTKSDHDCSGYEEVIMRDMSGPCGWYFETNDGSLMKINNASDWSEYLEDGKEVFLSYESISVSINTMCIGPDDVVEVDFCKKKR